ncbi:diguanylate cyclase [Romboutsia ilealis]|uniref:Sensor domain-containing diguanylate cyclase n=1 Tax=Romboutsia faecis TaxID=2764597 RepID=A0ABR7JQD8_9FIRM|nr:sensor domain-containing diguanylate cyclase [Romboutsia faecis]MBC5997135.1 sensor domain-containing diguanylate cyclase [Romboutsia faecis]MRN23416.1 diguanylate cyclase [Romboutsia ilealis]
MDIDIMIKILDNQENGIIILNKYKKVLHANKAAKDFLGNDLNQLLGDYLNCERTVIEKVNCQNITRCKSCIINRTIDRVIKTKDTEVINNVEVKKNQIDINLSMKISLCEEQYIVIELFNLNIKNLQMNFLSRLADKSKDIMFFKDEKLRYLYINKTFEDFLNKEKEYIIGKKDIDLVNENLLDPNLYEQCFIGDKEALEKGYYYGIEVMAERKFRVSKENIDGGILCIARDITDEIEAIKKSEIDNLTGIYNRNKFKDIINEIYLNKESEYYMALIDLDDLRNLNNKYGHVMGDKYLNILGRILKSQNNSVFFRIGGDEFAGLINYNQVCPEEVFKKIFKEINKLSLDPKLSVSVGINKFDITKDYEKNYEITDKVLYEAKKNGKNKFIISYGK